jgi:hypothetical protein
MGYDYGNDVAIDSAGDVLFAGGRETSSTAPADVYVAKFSGVDGSLIWDSVFTGPQNDFARGIAVDPASGDVFIVGTFRDDMPVGTDTLSSNGSDDIFVARLNGADGVAEWAVSFGGSSMDGGNGIALTPTGDVMVVGGFFGTVVFGGISRTSAGQNDVIVLKLDPNDGTVLWATRYGSTGSDQGQTIAADSAGNLAVGGQFTGTVSFGTTMLTAGGTSRDAFLAKLDGDDGTSIWAKKFGDSSGDDETKSVAIDSSDNVIVTGRMLGSNDFGGGSLSSAGMGDVFVAKYGSGGSYVWADRYGSTGDDVGLDVSVDDDNNILVTGGIAGTVSFGSTVLMSAGIKTRSS